MKTEIGILYRTNGVVERVQPNDGKKFRLDELQHFVGGDIELVPHSRPCAYCNDTGLLDNLPVNYKASEAFDIVLRGDVIWRIRMAQGDLTKAEATRIKEAVDDMFNGLSKSKKIEYLGHLNDIFLFLEACIRKMP